VSLIQITLTPDLRSTPKYPKVFTEEAHRATHAVLTHAPKEVGMHIIVAFVSLVVLFLGLVALAVFVWGLLDNSSDREDPFPKG